jgi:hypothetical protein
LVEQGSIFRLYCQQYIGELGSSERDGRLRMGEASADQRI